MRLVSRSGVRPAGLATRIPRYTFFFPPPPPPLSPLHSNRAPKQRDNECTQPCRRPAASSPLLLSASCSYLSQTPAGVATGRGKNIKKRKERKKEKRKKDQKEKERKKKEREQDEPGSSLIIHHRVRGGRNKNGRSSFPLFANTFIQRGFYELSRLLFGRRSGLTSTLFASRLFLSASKRVVRAPCLADTSRDYQFSSVDGSRDSKEKERGGGRKIIDTPFCVIGERSVRRVTIT